MIAALLLTMASPMPSAPPRLCRMVHGKLYVANGTPGFRILDLRTRRVLGTGSGDDLSGNNLPANIRRLWLPVGNLFDADIYGEFQVCAWKKQRPGEMQMVRVMSGRDLTLKRR